MKKWFLKKKNIKGFEKSHWETENFIQWISRTWNYFYKSTPRRLFQFANPKKYIGTLSLSLLIFTFLSGTVKILQQDLFPRQAPLHPRP
jgi:hypothetical protein